MEYKNILITGGCGFIGSNFVNYIVPLYPETNFYNIDALYYSGNVNHVKITKHSNYKYINGNIKDIPLIDSIFKNYNIDAVIHFAAQSHVDTSFVDSFIYTEDNIYGTQVLLHIATLYKHQFKKFIHISTDEVYGESSDISKTEESVLNPTNPYAASKAAAEMMVNAYKYSHNLPVVITRGNNVYGPNQHDEKLIPKFINLLENNKKCTLHGQGKSIRSFLHVGDVVRAIEIILLRGVIGEIYNIGTDKEYSIIEIATKLINKIHNTNDTSLHVEYIPDRLYNDKRYFISYKKLSDLGWEPIIELDDGLTSLLKEYSRGYTTNNI